MNETLSSSNLQSDKGDKFIKSNYKIIQCVQLQQNVQRLRMGLRMETQRTLGQEDEGKTEK